MGIKKLMRHIDPVDRSLWMFMLVTGMLIFGRVTFSDSGRYLFLIWNLFLAWLPYILAKYFKLVQHKAVWKRIFLFCLWLVFFPNAFYVITDLVHLKQVDAVPLWYDAVLLFCAAFVGVAMAIISFYRAEKLLFLSLHKRVALVISPLLIILSGYGVYLGRFQRWNSWDVMSRPTYIVSHIWSDIFNPVEHLRVWLITGIFSVVFYCIFQLAKSILATRVHHN